jgi:transcriptional regulator GlxA family with amidase domain
MPYNVAIFLYDDVEVLDFAGPFEVFCTATRMLQRQDPLKPPFFNTFTVAGQPGLVKARGQLQIQPHYYFDQHPAVDVLIVPGGVVTAELERPETLDWLGRTAQTAQVVASVCTGAFLLAKIGLLNHQQATTHWEDVPDLRAAFPQLEVLEQVRWVDNGRVLTSAGISAGLDMSLHLVEKLAGRELALKTAYQMDYDWRQP